MRAINLFSFFFIYNTILYYIILYYVINNYMLILLIYNINQYNNLILYLFYVKLLKLLQVMEDLLNEANKRDNDRNVGYFNVLCSQLIGIIILSNN